MASRTRCINPKCTLRSILHNTRQVQASIRTTTQTRIKGLFPEGDIPVDLGSVSAEHDENRVDSGYEAMHVIG